MLGWALIITFNQNLLDLVNTLQAVVGIDLFLHSCCYILLHRRRWHCDSYSSISSGQKNPSALLKYSSFFYVFKHRCTVHWRRVIMNKLFVVIWSNQYNFFLNKNIKLFLIIFCFFKSGCHTQSLTQESNSLVDHKLLKTEGSSFLPNMHLWCTQARMLKMLFDCC